jgi:Zn-dependent protease
MPELPLFEKILLGAVPVVFAITVHEVAHGWAANRLGDPTARLMGRLTLNPLRHIDPIGTVVLPLILFSISNFVFGWAKPVPVDWRNLRRPRRDMALVAAAGPAANLLMLFFWALLDAFAVHGGAGDGTVAALLHFMATVGILVNAVLMLLNLLPLPPLDGSRVVSAVLPAKWNLLYGRLENWGLLVLVVLLFSGALSFLLEPPLRFLLGTVVSLFGLD